MITTALIVAAGRGTRAADVNGLPKQYRPLAGAPVLAHTIRAFCSAPSIDLVQVVIHPADAELYRAAVQTMVPKMSPPVPGGETRQGSVRLGLEALAVHAPARVLIHDAARPLVDANTIARVIGKLETHAGSIAAQPVADTLKRASPGGTITGTVDRAGLWRAQTPQGFRFAAILDAHRKAHLAGRTDFTDDAAIAEWAGLDVALVMGAESNIKLTTPEDFVMAERLITPPRATAETRTGTGFDVHRLIPGDHVWLCGVKVAHDHRLEGHSDADVGLHALTDAVLGAIGDGDIGQHFPPSDPQWRGAASHLFLADAARRVAARGGRIINVDVTLLCEAPRIAPHREAMRASIASILCIDILRVGVKATTTEGLGFAGRREGIAAMATATVVLPT